jgi:hypothetical protein
MRKDREEIARVRTIFDMKILTSIVKQVGDALEHAGIPYHVVGSFAVQLHMAPIDPEAAHITPRVEIAIDARDVNQLAPVLRQAGIAFEGKGDRILIHANEVEPGIAGLIEVYKGVWPRFPDPIRSTSGILVVPLDFLVRAMLERGRLEDRLLTKDLDWARLITPEIVASLPQELRTRLAEVRATE